MIRLFQISLDIPIVSASVENMYILRKFPRGANAIKVAVKISTSRIVKLHFSFVSGWVGGWWIGAFARSSFSRCPLKTEISIRICRTERRRNSHLHRDMVRHKFLNCTRELHLSRGSVAVTRFSTARWANFSSKIPPPTSRSASSNCRDTPYITLGITRGTGNTVCWCAINGAGRGELVYEGVQRTCAHVHYVHTHIHTCARAHTQPRGNLFWGGSLKPVFSSCFVLPPFLPPSPVIRHPGSLLPRPSAFPLSLSLFRVPSPCLAYFQSSCISVCRR